MALSFEKFRSDYRMFAIDTDSRIVRVIGDLDREVQTSYMVTYSVMVSDWIDINQQLVIGYLDCEIQPLYMATYCVLVSDWLYFNN